MKIKKHIKAKRQYVSPSIYVKTLQMESMLAGESAWASGGNMGSGDGTGGGNGGGTGGGNFIMSKKASYLEDDEIEE